MSHRWRRTALRAGALRLVLAAVVACCLEPAAAAYQVRHTHAIDGGCDFRAGWYVTVIGERLFAGGPWDEFDCGVYGYGLRVYDLTTGAFERELRGTHAAAASGEMLLLGHVDGVQVADPETFAVQRTLTGPNQDHPWLRLHGTVDDDVLAVGEGDTPETAGAHVTFRLAPDSGAVVQRYVVPRSPNHSMTTHVAAGGGVVAVGAFVSFAGSASGVFVFGADDGALRWSTPTPAAVYSPVLGHSVAVTNAYVLVGVPRIEQPGQVLVFATDTGELVRTLTPPVSSASIDFFGRAVAAAGHLAVVGARGIGDYTLRGRTFAFDLSDGRLLDTLSAPGEIPMGDAVALGDDVVVAAGNEYDGIVHVFERRETTVTTTTLPACRAGCDDGSDCTVDACLSGRCVSTSLTGFDELRCRLGQLRGAVGCAPSRRARRLGRRLDRLFILAETVPRADAASRPRLLRHFLKRFQAYCHRVERLQRRERLAPDCAAALSLGCEPRLPEPGLG